MRNPIAFDAGAATLVAGATVERITAKLPSPTSFFHFCRVPEAAIDWSRLGQLPNLEELNVLDRLGCKCRLDPMLTCEMHPCMCKKCNGINDKCSWRQLHADLLLTKKQLKNIDVRSDHDKLTYCEILQLNGVKPPASA